MNHKYHSCHKLLDNNKPNVHVAAILAEVINLRLKILDMLDPSAGAVWSSAECLLRCLTDEYVLKRAWRFKHGFF